MPLSRRSLRKRIHLIRRLSWPLTILHLFILLTAIFHRFSRDQRGANGLADSPFLLNPIDSLTPLPTHYTHPPSTTSVPTPLSTATTIFRIPRYLPRDSCTDLHQVAQVFEEASSIRQSGNDGGRDVSGVGISGRRVVRVDRFLDHSVGVTYDLYSALVDGPTGAEVQVASLPSVFGRALRPWSGPPLIKPVSIAPSSSLTTRRASLSATRDLFTSFARDLVKSKGDLVEHVDHIVSQLKHGVPDGNCGAKVHFALSLKNRAFGLMQVIRSIQLAIAYDTVVHGAHCGGAALWIADFESTDADIQSVFARSGLDGGVLIVQGGFTRSSGLQVAVDAAINSSPNDILLFTTDADVTLPGDFLDRVRRWTVRHEQAFAPRCFMLNFGATHEVVPEHVPSGHRDPVIDASARSPWEVYSSGGYLSEGFGLIGFWGSDHVGFDVEKFRHKWGGEDVDLAQRLMEVPLAIARPIEVGLFHIWHAREGTWYAGQLHDV